MYSKRFFCNLFFLFRTVSFATVATMKTSYCYVMVVIKATIPIVSNLKWITFPMEIGEYCIHWYIIYQFVFVNYKISVFNNYCQNLYYVYISDSGLNCFNMKSIILFVAHITQMYRKGSSKEPLFPYNNNNVYSSI